MRRETKIEGFRDRLHLAFLWSDKTGVQVCKETGILKSTFYEHIRGDSTPNALHLARYAVAFNVSADWLLGLKKERER